MKLANVQLATATFVYHCVTINNKAINVNALSLAKSTKYPLNECEGYCDIDDDCLVSE